MAKVFECRQCGLCCSGESTVSMTLDEQARIADFLGMTTEELLERYCRVRGNRVEMRVVEGHCVFYGDDGLCRIHRVKPFHCRRWPLHPAILGDQGAWEAIKADCPGFKEGVTWEDVCGLIGDEKG